MTDLASRHDSSPLVLAFAALLVPLALTACGPTGEQGGPRDDLVSTDSPSPEGGNDDGGSSIAPAPSPTEDTSADPAGLDCEDLTDVTSGRPLCDFEDGADYGYRLAAAISEEDLLGDLQAIAPWLEAGDVSDVYAACQDLAQGVPTATRVDDAITRFSGGATEQVDAAQAAELLAVADQYVCAG